MTPTAEMAAPCTDGEESTYYLVTQQSVDEEPVVVYDLDGNAICSFGLDTISYASASGIDNDGNLYVGSLKKIQKLTRDGELVLTWRANLDVPRAIVADANNQIYVLDTYANGLQKFDQDGNHTGSVDLPYNPGFIAPDGNGNVFIIDDKMQLMKLSPDGQLALFSTLDLGPDMSLKFVDDLTVDERGHVFMDVRIQIVFLKYHRILEVAADGSVVGFVGTADQPILEMQEFQSSAIEHDRQGHLMLLTTVEDQYNDPSKVKFVFHKYATEGSPVLTLVSTTETELHFSTSLRGIHLVQP